MLLIGISYLFSQNRTIRKINFLNLVKIGIAALSSIVFLLSIWNILYSFFENFKIVDSIIVALLSLFAATWSLYTSYNIQFVRFALLNKKGLKLELANKNKFFSPESKADIKYNDGENIIYMRYKIYHGSIRRGTDSSYTITVYSYFKPELPFKFKIIPNYRDADDTDRLGDLVKIKNFLVIYRDPVIKDIIMEFADKYGDNLVFTKENNFEVLESNGKKVEASFRLNFPILFENDEDFLYNIITQFSDFLKRIRSVL